LRNKGLLLPIRGMWGVLSGAGPADSPAPEPAGAGAGARALACVQSLKVHVKCEV
jgi:hypothetical protein